MLGTHVVLFLSCLKSVFKRGRWLGAYVSVLFLLATIGISLQVYWHEVAFITHRYDLGGPYAFLKDNVRHPVNIALVVIYLLLNWLSDGIVLYRFFVIYSVIGRHTAVTTVVSAVILLALIGTGSAFVPNIASLGSNLWTDISTAPGIAYLTLSLSVNVILTFLIVGRIVYLDRRLRALTAHSRHYTCIVALLIESAALYTFWALISVIACGISSPVQFALLPALGQFQAIPPLLILARVASGRALARDTYPITRFSTNCVETTPPPYCSHRDKIEFHRERAPSFVSICSTSKPPLEPLDISYGTRISCLDIKRSHSMNTFDSPDIFSDSKSPIESPKHVYFSAI
ncbi:hypothetical protein BXZ70DRAFT_895385 [Cristinia sonorae]|uniref:Uncharacterized protein n=1 Tax=Cristinia sonorae TaxID=1940300 RepID=A0A8K0UM19_9AGAR|nr:hypothetical protein BXZ70DRAFT_895385 [Cristinia sonorae]